MPPQPLENVATLIKQLTALPNLDKSSVERVLGTMLIHQPGTPSHLLHHEAELPSGEFGHVELREPNAQQQPVWILVLKPRTGVTLTLDQFMQGRLLGKDTPRDVNVHEPPAGSTTFTLPAPRGQTVAFGFRNDTHALISAAIRRSGGS